MGGQAATFRDAACAWGSTKTNVMNPVLLLSRLAALSVIAIGLGLALNALVLTLFAGAACVLVLLIATGDYSRRGTYPSDVRVAVRRRAEPMPLAA